jgi:hypothetical protein
MPSPISRSSSVVRSAIASDSLRWSYQRPRGRSRLVEQPSAMRGEQVGIDCQVGMERRARRNVDSTRRMVVAHAELQLLWGSRKFTP